jgi:hypothetical protein
MARPASRPKVVDLRPAPDEPQRFERQVFTLEQAAEILGCDRKTVSEAARGYEERSGYQVSWGAGEGGSPLRQVVLVLASWIIDEEAHRRNGICAEHRPLKCDLAQTRGDMPPSEKLRELQSQSAPSNELRELLSARDREIELLRHELERARAVARAATLDFHGESASG